ncbi:4Fe-4S binding protein [Thioclava sp. SK-1]|uniref:4Fe-4S binding protein n=1 Tax=Thioclava sp. SK-1 TaxID=1889770 RepID=UPI0021016A1C|nr:4Fe-4S binding protein [Thioclava sp. SK-1]
MLFATRLFAAPLTHDALQERITAPYALGEQISPDGVWSLLNSGGGEAGFVFQTGPLAPLPGFSGKPIDILVMLDLDGRFINTQLVSHNEPIFVSGLGEAPLRDFLSQYQGHSISEQLVIGTPYGASSSGSDLVFLDGVTKATASVRIAHESILAATLQVAREKMQGVSAGPPPQPKLSYNEPLSWDDLIAQGLVGRITASFGEVDQEFAGTLWADDGDYSFDPNDLFLDLYVIDMGPPAVANAVLAAETLAEVAAVRQRAPDDELILLIEAGHHGLVSDEFVRNTTPDRISAQQDALPLALRDADILPNLKENLPAKLHDATHMVVRLDRRLGFDPTREWTMTAHAQRSHGMFQPETHEVDFSTQIIMPERFYIFPQGVEKLSPFMEAVHNRQMDLWLLIGFLAVLFLCLAQQSRLAALRLFPYVRFGLLAIMTGFIGFWGQGQLSVVTPLAVVNAAIGGGSLSVLLYDPFSLLIWAATFVGFVLWGRGFFCGWLCPFGALQEFSHHIGRLLHLPQIRPPRSVARAMLWTGPIALVGLVLTTVFWPTHTEMVVEVEPFKTAITMHFARPWPYAIWAGAWIMVSMVWFKGFCRSLCPLGAAMRVGGFLRFRRWIPRRAECGSPCQLCRVKCHYDAIENSGKIRYSECFQCLDCVTIHDSDSKCVPLIIARKRLEKMTNQGGEALVEQ